MNDFEVFIKFNGDSPDIGEVLELIDLEDVNGVIFPWTESISLFVEDFGKTGRILSEYIEFVRTKVSERFDVMDVLVNPKNEEL